MTTAYRRIPHAAHYGYGRKERGHDLEEWVVTLSAVEVDMRPEECRRDVPADAEFCCGNFISGVQSWTYTRRAPMSAGECARCNPKTEITT